MYTALLLSSWSKTLWEDVQLGKHAYGLCHSRLLPSWNCFVCTFAFNMIKFVSQSGSWIWYLEWGQGNYSTIEYKVMLCLCGQELLGHIYATFFSSRGMEQFMARFPELVNMVKVDDEHTALHIAAANDHLDVVRLLASVVCTYL